MTPQEKLEKMGEAVKTLKKGEITTLVKLTPKYIVEFGWIERDRIKVSPLVDKFEINWKGFENLQILFEMKG